MQVMYLYFLLYNKNSKSFFVSCSARARKMPLDTSARYKIVARFYRGMESVQVARSVQS